MDNKQFWKDIIYKDGKIDEEQVMKELEDYSFLMEQAGIVYCEVTGGLLSKVSYNAKTIIAEFQEKNYNKFCTQEDIKNIINNEKMSSEEKLEEIKSYFEI